VLILAALFVGVVLGFYLAIVAVSSMFEHPTSDDCLPDERFISRSPSRSTQERNVPQRARVGAHAH
jgi:hypothetical protein